MGPRHDGRRAQVHRTGGTPILPRVRPAVDVVVPFLDDERSLHALLKRLRELELGPEDTVVVVDNRPRSGAATPAPEVLRAPERQSSYYARNRGVARGSAPWLLFLDADVLAPADLVDRYFAEAPDERTAVLAGAIEDLPPERPGLAGRYARLSRALNDDNTWRPGFAYAQTASAAVRREAFEAADGFLEVRSGGDADLCFRLAQAGWRIERRPRAVVRHRSRASVRGLVRQYLRYGSGAAWLERRYPGFAPARSPGSVALQVIRGEVAAARALARRDRDGAVRHALDPVCTAAFALGRRLPNDVGSSADRHG
jgi:mycofactocin glycosyltransferase